MHLIALVGALVTLAGPLIGATPPEPHVWVLDPQPEKSWVNIETRYFRLQTDLSPDRAAEIIMAVEFYEAFITSMFRRDLRRGTIFVITDPARFQAYSFAAELQASDAGFVMIDEVSSISVVFDSPAPGGLSRSVFRAMLHGQLATHGLPLWLEYGLSSLLSSLTLVDHEIWLGLSPLGFSPLSLDRGLYHPLPHLLSLAELPVDSNGKRAFFSESSLLVHYLILRDGQRLLRDLLCKSRRSRCVSDDEDGALDLKALASELVGYSRLRHTDHLRIPFTYSGLVEAEIRYKGEEKSFVKLLEFLNVADAAGIRPTGSIPPYLAVTVRLIPFEPLTSLEVLFYSPILVREDEWFAAADMPGLVAARKLSGPQPVYPENARKERTEGEVRLLLTIDTNGEVKRVELVEGSAEFTEAAIEAARQTKFTPATLAGLPVPTQYEFHARFRMQ